MKITCWTCPRAELSSQPRDSLSESGCGLAATGVASRPEASGANDKTKAIAMATHCLSPLDSRLRVRTRRRDAAPKGSFMEVVLLKQVSCRGRGTYDAGGRGLGNAAINFSLKECESYSLMGAAYP